MKTVYIIRHAKSDQSFFGNDFERPLNERGKSDAPMMAECLLNKKVVFDALIASPAKRAKQTAALFAKNFNMVEDDIILVSALYHAPEEVFYEVITALPDELHTVAIFSHNPGITYFVNSLNTKLQVNNMPTCSIFAVTVNIESWAAFEKAEKDFLLFEYPKR